MKDKTFITDSFFFLPQTHDALGGGVINGLTHPGVFVDLAREGTSVNPFLYYEYIRRNFIAHWLIKIKFNGKHKIPASRQAVSTMKPIGRLYAECFSACERLHTFGFLGEYRNAAHWWGLIVIEQRLEGLNVGTKARSLSKIRQENNLIASYENPFEIEQFPHTYRLFEFLLRMAEKQDIFRKEVLKPLLDARKNWATCYKKPEYQIGFTKDGENFRQMAGRGSGAQLLPDFLFSDGFKKVVSTTLTRRGL